MPKTKRKKHNRHNRIGGAVSSWARTDVGLKREKNEDSYLIDSSLMLYMVADGMGGHAGGETASKMAVETVHETLQEARKRGDVFSHDSGEVEDAAIVELLDNAIREASKMIYDASTERPELQGMGTTITLSLFLGKRCYIAHVGDSRLYRYRNGQGFEQLTEDHSLVAEQVKAGFITVEEAQFSRFRNIITRSVGFESTVVADTFSFVVEEGDVFLVCSDGLTGMVTDEEIYQILSSSRLENARDRLIDMANRNGGEDNITLVLLRYKGAHGRSATRSFRRREAKRFHRNRKRAII